MSKLTSAFKELRKAGYFAKQNFWCCQSCAWHAVPEERADRVVFYHKQDKESLARSGSVHLAWSGNGHEICRILNENGIATEWEGNENKRILALIS